MIRNILVLPDGTELAAGAAGHNALRSLRWNCAVNAGTDRNPGSACADSLEAEIWVEPGADPGLAEGEEITLWRVAADGTRRKAGIFVTQKPTRSRRNLCRVTAYDRMVLTEKDLSAWLRERQTAFPMTLTAFARAVAAACGVTLANEPPRNGSYRVQPFYADGLTGRQMLQWVAQAAGCYLHCNADGALAFGWYTDRRTEHCLSPGGQGDGVSGTPMPYRQDGLSYAEYVTAAVDKVQIRQSDSDVGVLYPPDETGTNALVIQGNLLLTAQSADALRPVAQALYEAARTWPAYTPCTVSAFADCEAAPGELLSVITPRGQRLTTCLMSACYTAEQTRLESTGNARRDSVAAVNAARLNLSGKLLEIQADIGELNVRAGDLQGNYTQLSQSVEGLRTRTETLAGDFSELEQSVDGMALRVEQGAAKMLLDGCVWQVENLSPSGTALVDGTRATLQASTGMAHWTGVRMEVPAALLAEMPGRSYRVSFDYRVDQEIRAASGSSVAVLWQDYDSGNVYTYLREYSSASRGTATPVQDWQTVSVDVTCKTEPVKRFYMMIYLYPGTGCLQLRNAAITDVINKRSEILLDRDGVTISSAELDLSDYAAQQDYARLRMEQDTLSLEVVRDGEVRSAFAADDSSIVINSGRITFLSDTLAVQSENFTLLPDGSVTATGTLTSTDGQNTAELRSGNFTLLRKAAGTDEICVSIFGLGNTSPDGTVGVYQSNALGERTSMASLRSDFVGGRVYLNNAYNTLTIFLEGGEGKITCQQLQCSGAKQRAVRTGFGTLGMNAWETPTPSFSDCGTGRCDETGQCLLTLDPRFAETVCAARQPVWVVTPLSPGALWVEAGTAATVHGAPGQWFAWQVTAAQRGYEALYADPVDALGPGGATTSDSAAAAALWRQIGMAEETQRTLQQHLLEG